jgi:uncharacterized protein RhaS with RHS repeats
MSGSIRSRSESRAGRFSYDDFSNTANYLYEGMNLLEEVDSSGNVLARYTQGPGVDQPVAQHRSGATSYYQADGLGSITSLTGSDGTISGTYAYDTFGNLSGSTGTLTNSFRIPGASSIPRPGCTTTGLGIMTRPRGVFQMRLRVV